MASLGRQLVLMAQLADVTASRVEPELGERTARVLERADQRLAMGQQTVIALAGPTGAGKSSLMNALAQAEIATPGIRRPTTSTTLAVSFGPTNTDLLDWLEVQRRHEVAADVMPDVVLLDLPDHDSVVVSHHVEVERLVKVVDQFVWVTDPQKYADASIHKRYLRPLAGHRDVITVVLNQADRLRPHELAQCMDHLGQLLADDGLSGVQVFAVSARTGDGIERLRDRLAAIAASKSAAANRLLADLSVLTDEFEHATAGGKLEGVGQAGVARLEEGMARAAGVPIVERAVQQAMLHRGMLATGWPLVNWWRRLRPDPLRRLRLGGGHPTRELDAPATVTARSSLPQRGAVADAQLATALRGVADETSRGMPELWRAAVHDSAHRTADTLPDVLDNAVAETDLGTDRVPVWWQLLKFLQWLLIAAVVVGVGWLSVNVVLMYFQLPSLPEMVVGSEGGFRVPLPTALVGGGLAAGFVLSVLARIFVSLGAGAARRRARRRLRRSVSAVAQAEVVAPLNAEIDRYRRARELVKKLR